ncbi:MAG: 50S ribosomal protein L33 [Chlamydiae bacterium RIFCSPHIGHO2_12_FULL_49_11]|nr:MAG: 50S ribosomal protein L33 [Chlamydiae bacterium RIFCSPHIGHO2_12_FULL_49_11]
MAKKKSRQVVTLECTESNTRYATYKNPKNTTGRLELKKYCPELKRHALFREKK